MKFTTTLFTTLAFSGLFALAGCSSDEPGAQTEELVDESGAEILEETADTNPPPPAEVADPATSQVVEESVGEPEVAEAKPLILAEADTSAQSAKSTTSAPVREWKFKEGQHFQRLVPTQPTVGGADKVEVSEFFWYGCGHCYEFESYISQWEQTKSDNSRFVRIPATWNPLVLLHAQLYYAEEVLVNNGKITDPHGFRAAVFNEYHRRNNRLTSLDSIKQLFAKFNVSETDFDNAWGSFEVAQKLRIAQDLARRYAISGVPAMVVNGKYRTGKAETGTYPKLLEVVDELVERETQR